MPTLQPTHRASLAAAVVLSVAMTGPALADDVTRPAVDISKVAKKLTVLHDGAGHYIVAGDWSHRTHLYWGDGSTFYRQRFEGGRNSRKTRVLSYDFWAPRDSRSKLTRTDKAWTLECSTRTTELQVLAGDEARTMLGSAAFHSYYWQREPYALYRDARGRYYYVDRLRDDDYDDADFRLYIGKKGALKRKKLSGVARDESGDVFSTKRGELRIAANNGRGATWVTGDRQRELDERYPSPKLIYRDLGLHTGTLGVPCDAL